MNVLFILGNWFGEGGLKDICIEVELVVEVLLMVFLMVNIIIEVLEFISIFMKF